MMEVATLISLSQTGAGLTLDASKYGTANLISIVNSSTGTVTLKNLKKLSSTSLICIANANPGKVMFDFT